MAITQKRLTIETDQVEVRKLLDQGKTELQKFRYQMSSKESELLQIFRELMSCNFYVPEHHFDRQLKEERKERKVKQESYNIPLKVFWRPVETKDLTYDYEPNLGEKKYQLPINPMPNLDVHSYGQFLAKPLRDDLLKRNLAKMDRLKKGELASALHEIPPQPTRSETIKFEKYMSTG